MGGEDGLGCAGIVGFFGIGEGLAGDVDGIFDGSFGTGRDGGFLPGLGLTLGDGITLSVSGLITGFVLGLIAISRSMVGAPPRNLCPLMRDRPAFGCDLFRGTILFLFCGDLLCGCGTLFCGNGGFRLILGGGLGEGGGGGLRPPGGGLFGRGGGGMFGLKLGRRKPPKGLPPDINRSVIRSLLMP